MAGPKPMRTEVGIHLTLESCVTFYRLANFKIDDNLFLSDYTWEVDQKISSRAIMKSGLCSLPPENKLWKEINIEPR